MTAFICICSEEYLGYYKVLYESIKKYCPQVTPILYFIGQNPPYDKFNRCIDITRWYENCNPSYDKLTKICSLRAKVVLNAFKRGYEKVIFTGAKVEFFDYPYKLIDPLSVIQNPFKAVVTPHILEPLPEDDLFPSNAAVSFTGHISTDVVSFLNCDEIRKFLTWQDEIMKTKCSTTAQTYLDQSWLNFLPFFVDDVKILRDPAYNIAYWNYKQRDLDNIVCFQYSGLDLDNPKSISTHQNRYQAEGYFLNFLEHYAKRVKDYTR
jgi:hypothetical protein